MIGHRRRRRVPLPAGRHAPGRPQPAPPGRPARQAPGPGPRELRHDHRRRPAGPPRARRPDDRPLDRRRRPGRPVRHQPVPAGRAGQPPAGHVGVPVIGAVVNGVRSMESTYGGVLPVLRLRARPYGRVPTSTVGRRRASTAVGRMLADGRPIDGSPSWHRAAASPGCRPRRGLYDGTPSINRHRAAVAATDGHGVRTRGSAIGEESIPTRIDGRAKISERASAPEPVAAGRRPGRGGRPRAGRGVRVELRRPGRSQWNRDPNYSLRVLRHPDRRGDPLGAAAAGSTARSMRPTLVGLPPAGWRCWPCGTRSTSGTSSTSRRRRSRWSSPRLSLAVGGAGTCSGWPAGARLPVLHAPAAAEHQHPAGRARSRRWRRSGSVGAPAAARACRCWPRGT